MWNGYQKLYLNKILLLFNVDIPPQVMNLILILTFLSNIPPMLSPNLIQYDILLLVKVRISLF